MSDGDLLKLLLTALFSAGATLFVTLFVTWVKTTRDEEASQTKDFCDALLRVAGFGAEYWLKEPHSVEHDLLQTQVLGGQTYLDHSANLLFASFSKADVMELRSQLADFYDALSGGQFYDGSVEFNRAREIQVRASMLAVSVKGTARRSASMTSRFVRQVQRTSRQVHDAWKHVTADYERSREWRATGNWP